MTPEQRKKVYDLVHTIYSKCYLPPSQELMDEFSKLAGDALTELDEENDNQHYSLKTYYLSNEEGRELRNLK